MIIALAGRRIDAAGVKGPRFPLQNAPLVSQRVRSMLLTQKAVALVSSAACGADLLALAVAGELGLRRRVVLPFDRARFRASSVTDRPGEWGALYDQTMDAIAAAGDLVVMDGTPEHADYTAANLAILNEAEILAAELGEPRSAVLVWEGATRGDHDVTEAFGTEARRRGLPVIEISTADSPAATTARGSE
jgi:hypothetical protein